MAYQIETVAIGKLRPWARNARTHSKKQIRQIADSIRRFGFTNPVLIDRENTILAGHGRVAAAASLEMGEVPCLRIENLTPEEKRAYVLADNKLALNAGWDEELLAQELKALSELDIDFDVGITGFSISEIDNLVDGLAPEEPGDPADDRLPSDAPAGASLATSGSSGRIGWSAEMPATRRRSQPSWRANSLNWSSPTRRTMCLLMATWAALDRSGIASSPWPQAR
jgi:ParB-like chromosome segregation protein Spo0J